MAWVNHTRMLDKHLYFQREFKKFMGSFHVEGIRLEEIFFSKNVQKAQLYSMTGHTKFVEYYIGVNFD